jgi:hypothetical protein
MKHFMKIPNLIQPFDFTCQIEPTSRQILWKRCRLRYHKTAKPVSIEGLHRARERTSHGVTHGLGIKKVKLSLQQAVEAHWVVRRRGSHIL